MRWQDRAHSSRWRPGYAPCPGRQRAGTKGYRKRGGGARQVSLDDALVICDPRSDELVALDDALTQFAAVSPRKAQVVELRFLAA